MKVKDLLKALEGLDPELEVVTDHPIDRAYDAVRGTELVEVERTRWGEYRDLEFPGAMYHSGSETVTVVRLL